MTDKLKIILNPYGGREKGQKKIAQVEQALAQFECEYDLAVTNAPGHATELTQAAVQEGWPVVIAAGGDGTINEIVNGLLAAAGEGEVGTLGILPVGTANDLADMLEIPRDLKGACARIVAGQTRLIDVGQVNGRYFVNNSAVGLEPMVSLAHEAMRWVSGDLRYILAAVRTIFQAKFWQMSLTWDDQVAEEIMTLVSVGNSRRTGGAFYMTPQAELDDGLLDFVFAPQLSRLALFRLLPQTFKGLHIHHPLVTMARTTDLMITASPGTPIQADGEIIERDARKIHYKILPKKLRVIV